MPSSEEILKQFRDAQASLKDSDPIRNEVMARKLEALIAEQHPEKSAQMAYDLMRDHSDSAMGVAVCQCLLNKPDGIKLATNVGRAVTTAELGKVTNTNGVESFLRGNSSSSTFSKEFITQTSPDYVNSINRKAQQLAQKHGVDKMDTLSEENRLKAMIDLSKDLKSMACNTDDLSPESKQYLSALNQGVQDDKGFAARFSGSAEVSMEKAIETQKRLGEIAINNSAALRFVMSEVTINPQLNKNQYWKACAQLAQKSFNLTQKDSLGNGSEGHYKLITGKEAGTVSPRTEEINEERKNLREQIKQGKEEGLDTTGLEEQDRILSQEQDEIIQSERIESKNRVELKTKPLMDGLHTEETRKEVTDMMKSLKETEIPEDLGMDFEGAHQNTTAERQLNDENLTQAIKTEAMEKSLEPFNDHLKQLEARKKQLSENPTWKDKIKGFFNHGFKGVKGEIAKIDKEITATNTAKEDIQKGVSVADRRDLVETLKEGLRAHQTDIKQSLSQATKGGIEQINPGINYGVDNEERNQAIEDIDDKQLVQKEMLTRLKAEQKVISVREKLSMTQGSPKVEAPKVHHSVK
jgi:hypothetical protein